MKRVVKNFLLLALFLITSLSTSAVVFANEIQEEAAETIVNQEIVVNPELNFVSSPASETIADVNIIPPETAEAAEAAYIGMSSLTYSATSNSITLHAANYGHNSNVRFTGTIRIWTGTSYRDYSFDIYSQGMPNTQTWTIPGWTKFQVLNWSSTVVSGNSNVLIQIGLISGANNNSNQRPVWPWD